MELDTRYNTDLPVFGNPPWSETRKEVICKEALYCNVPSVKEAWDQFAEAYNDDAVSRTMTGEQLNAVCASRSSYAPQAQFLLGKLILEPDLNTPDFVTAREVFTTAARNGHADAQYMVGHMWCQGIGGEMCQVEAMRHFRMAAEQEHSGAQLALGIMKMTDENFLHKIALGVDTDEDRNDCQGWIYSAARNGHCDAEMLVANVAWLRDVDKDEEGAPVARTLFKSLVRKGVVKALHNLACMLALGEGGPHDEIEAKRLFERAADEGCGASQFALSCIYHGSTHEEDAERAVEYLKCAADQGYTAALRNLGLCYKDGYVVTRDLDASKKYLALASDQGDLVAGEVLFELTVSDFMNNGYENALRQAVQNASVDSGREGLEMLDKVIKLNTGLGKSTTLLMQARRLRTDIRKKMQEDAAQKEAEAKARADERKQSKNARRRANRAAAREQAAEEAARVRASAENQAHLAALESRRQAVQVQEQHEREAKQTKEAERRARVQAERAQRAAEATRNAENDNAVSSCFSSESQGRRSAAKERAVGPKADAQTVISKAKAAEHEACLREAEASRVAHERELEWWRKTANAISRGD